MRVALIEAGSPGLNIYSHVAMGRGVPLLATVLRDAGHEVRAFVEDIGGKGRIDWGFVRRAEVAGFSAITCTLTRTADLVRQTQLLNPGAAIVFGGPEPTCAPARSFEAGADFVIRGEAERSLLRFLDAVRGWRRGDAPSEALRSVPGIVWREGGSLRFGPPPQQLVRAEVDALPFIDMSLVEGAERRTTGLVWRSRGCPERCTFCEVHEIWPRYVLRDERMSVEELIRCQDEGSGGVFLIDDNAAANKPSFKRFLRGAIERGYARPLTLQIRADAMFEDDDRLDSELLALLREVAPVTTVCIGVESAEDDDLVSVDKRIDSERIAAALQAIRRSGILVHGMFIAFARDTLETLKRNGRFARRYVTSLQYLFETPLPGTKATAEHEAAGHVLFHRIDDLKFLDGMRVAIQPYRTSARQMQEAVIAEYKKFYSRTRIAKALVEGILLRHRRLGAGMREHLRHLKPAQRLREWAWMHVQYKFAPFAVLRVGRQRVRAFLRDPEYVAYLRALQD